MTLRRRAAAVAAVPLLVLAACSGSTTGGAATPSGRTGAVATSNVDVDTPALRRLKERAGVADCPTPPADAPAAESPLPDVVLPCLGGGHDVDLAHLRGPLVINLWAQWCGPCRSELPYYERLHRRAGDQVQVVGVDYQDPQPEQALELVRQTGVTYPLLADPGAALRVPFRIRALPGVVLVDEDGSVVHLEYTVIRSYPDLTGLVRKYLHVTP
ncbi:MAG TPA: TlpA disulfide reductase family protein [Nocardioidaceae bacterium]